MAPFPPTVDTQVTLANWRKPPFNRWSFSHVSEIVPSSLILNDPGRVQPLEQGPAADLSSFRIGATSGAMSLEQWLEDTYTDALLVLRGNEIVHEQYMREMNRRLPHILMSVSKSVLGLLAGVLVEQGVFDPSAKVTSIIPEVSGSAYDNATLRDLLDMRAGVLFEENYLADGGPIIAYRKAQGWDPLRPGEEPTDLRNFFKLLSETDGHHGDRFHYVSPNTDLLGWVMERLTGKRYADLVSEYLWAPIGAEENAYITVDRLGAPRCAGGLCATVRDLARIGRLFVTNGRVGDEQVVPEAWMIDIMTSGDRDAWDRGDFIELFPGVPMHYRNQWYVEHGEHPMVFGIGVFGQNVFIEPASDLVIVKFSSQPLPLNAQFTALTRKGINALRELLR
ncbi:serine hydrolase domain-containing protein [Salinicola peritrichatus]|uniref:serine hydrolase domain-containing protein n=1 Tax=Salinicola peritrichatus TaxID=1267424 RepID=UPI0019550599|nr:serine hydrolase [Salinicola peritrichatus]